MKFPGKQERGMFISTIISILIFTIPLVIFTILDLIRLPYGGVNCIDYGFLEVGFVAFLFVFSGFFIANGFITSKKQEWEEVLCFTSIASAVVFPIGIWVYMATVLYTLPLVAVIIWIVLALANSVFMAIMAFSLYREELKTIPA